ncbi:MAG: hypothetical protein JWM50_132 [Microbacteriaceae bacterium]|jgi:hypothetical protein|nr:hypothetical protein [Microbacteriaceae bacterium]
MVDDEILRFDEPHALRAWLDENQDVSSGVWLQLALRCGWTDGQARRLVRERSGGRARSYFAKKPR